MMNRPAPLAAITGASSGIGAAFARELARRGARLHLAARRSDRLRELAREIESAHGRPVLTRVVDLDDETSFVGYRTEVLDLEPDILINNAGFGMNRRFVDCDLDRMESLIRVDLQRPLELCRSVGRGMAARGSGRILNVASIAGLVPTPFHAVYAAAKAGLLVFGEGFAIEMKDRGVVVSTLCPGVTDTEFFAAGDYSLKSPVYRLRRAAALSVARAGLRGLERGRVVLVPGLGNRLLLLLVRALPRRLVVAAAGRAMCTD